MYGNLFNFFFNLKACDFLDSLSKRQTLAPHPPTTRARNKNVVKSFDGVTENVFKYEREMFNVFYLGDKLLII